MPLAPVRPTHLLIAWLATAAATAQAEVGATVSLQSDARHRGLSYSGDKPGAQLGLAWDGAAGWYGGGQLARADFSAHCCGAWVQAYGGRVFALAPGLDAEAGLIANRYAGISRYDYHELYIGLLGERWNLRLYRSPDYYGAGQATVYAEWNQRWPLFQGVAALGHVGVLRSTGGQPPAYLQPRGATRADLRLGASVSLGGASELQVAVIAAGTGGATSWTDTRRRRTLVLGLNTAF